MRAELIENTAADIAAVIHDIFSVASEMQQPDYALAATLAPVGQETRRLHLHSISTMHRAARRPIMMRGAA